MDKIHFLLAPSPMPRSMLAKSKYAKSNYATRSQALNTRTMGAVGIELKWYDTGLYIKGDGHGASLVGYVGNDANVHSHSISLGYYLNGIGQGSAFNQRIGRSATIKSIHSKGSIVVNCQQDYIYRIMLVQDTQTNAQLTSISQVLSPAFGHTNTNNNTSILSYLELANQKRYKIHYDYTGKGNTGSNPVIANVMPNGDEIVVQQVAGTQRPRQSTIYFDINKRVNTVVNYIAPGATGPSVGPVSIADNSFFLWVQVSTLTDGLDPSLGDDKVPFRFTADVQSRVRFVG